MTFGMTITPNIYLFIYNIYSRLYNKFVAKIIELYGIYFPVSCELDTEYTI